MYDQITADVKVVLEKQPCLNRSFDLFTMLHTLQLENQFFTFNSSVDESRGECIVIFHCGNRKLFHADQGSSPLYQSTDANECHQILNEQAQSRIFLVISGDMIPSEIHSTFHYQQIYAIYFFRNNELEYPINIRKVSGLFDKLEDLSERLYKNIRFYREQHMHTSRIHMFSTIEQTQKLISQLNDKQIDFLVYNFFIDILPLVPTFEFKLEDITKICDILFPSQGTKVARYVNDLQKETDHAKNFIQDPKFSQIILRLDQLDNLNNLFILQKPLTDIQNRVLKSTEIPKSLTVYLVKIISVNDLEMIRSEYDKFISIGSFILATKSLLTARTIARKMVDDGLLSVLIQIEVAEGIRLLETSSDHVIFHLGAVFRLESMNLAPDGVWYAKIKSADSEFQVIKEQIQLEIEVPLSWLTYGNYLYFLRRPQLAETYFKYLLEKLPSGHIDRGSSIYSNILVYSMKNGKDGKAKAEKIYDEAFKCAQSVEYISTGNEYNGQTCVATPGGNVTLSNTSIDHSTVLGNIADVYYQKGDYKLALEHYKQALELSTDARCRSYYKQMILNVINHS
jgi:tetratricopeptide (TPR) repeat protein